MAAGRDLLAHGKMVVGQTGTFVAPGLADFDAPALAVYADMDNAMRVPELDLNDVAGYFKIAIFRPAPPVVCTGRQCGHQHATQRAYQNEVKQASLNIHQSLLFRMMLPL